MENKNKTVVTREGYEKLKAEYEYLIHEERDQVIAELQEARAQGDLSENADYDAARDHQARLEARISEVEAMLNNVEIIEDDSTSKGQVVSLGSVVTIKDLSDNVEETYKIVGSVEADPFNGLLSNETPLAKAILDQKVGNVVSVTGIEEPYDVKIIDLK